MFDIPASCGKVPSLDDLVEVWVRSLGLDLGLPQTGRDLSVVLKIEHSFVVNESFFADPVRE
jgi:hypothetical protein